MKNLKHLAGYLLVILLTFFLTKKLFCGHVDKSKETVSDCVIPKCDEPCKPNELVVQKLPEILHSYKKFHQMRYEVRNSDSIDPDLFGNLKRLFHTEGIWFDYSEFKEYIAFIDKNAKDANIKISGLRFFPIISSKEKPGQMSLFYNPTIEKSTGHFSYALKRVEGKLTPVFLREELEKKPYKQKQEGSLFSFLNSASFEELESQSGNRGQLNPPPSDLKDNDDNQY